MFIRRSFLAFGMQAQVKSSVPGGSGVEVRVRCDPLTRQIASKFKSLKVANLSREYLHTLLNPDEHL